MEEVKEVADHAGKWKEMSELGLLLWKHNPYIEWLRIQWIDYVLDDERFRVAFEVLTTEPECKLYLSIAISNLDWWKSTIEQRFREVEAWFRSEAEVHQVRIVDRKGEIVP